MKKLTILTITAAMVLATAAHAQVATNTNPENTPKIDQRIENQQKRIQQGVASGALTQQEADKMNAHEQKVQADLAKDKADGKVTKRERAKLNRELTRDSKRIKREKHNDKTTGQQPAAE